MSDSLEAVTGGSDYGPSTFRIIGPGRAGTSIATALTKRGWHCVELLGRGDDLSNAASGVRLLVIAVPDDAISAVASAVQPVAKTVVCHMSGSRTLQELEPHSNVGSIHPLMSLPDPDVGAARLLDNCTFAICGSDLMADLVKDLGGKPITIADADRATYHAAASVAANHLVALCAQVERLAHSIGVPSEAFFKLMSTSLDNAAANGAKAALTGPAARGDWATLRAHLGVLDLSEHASYLAMAQSAARLADQSWPSDLCVATPSERTTSD